MSGSEQCIEVWMGVSGTTGECGCGWRKHMPAGILPSVVMAAAELHERETGHHWPTEAEAAFPVGSVGEEQP